MVATLLTKVKAKSIHSFWTIDGKILFKDDESADPKRCMRHSNVVEPLPVTEEDDTEH